MPLDYSGTREAISANIKAEMAAGKPHKQAVAIALSVDRKARGINPYEQKMREIHDADRRKPAR